VAENNPDDQKNNIQDSSQAAAEKADAEKADAEKAAAEKEAAEKAANEKAAPAVAAPADAAPVVAPPAVVIAGPAGPPPPESWLSRDIAPILALLATVATFLMFFYFVQVARGPVEEARAYSLAQLKLERMKSSASSAATKEVFDSDVKALTASADRAKLDLDEAKERLGMLKDFVIFILGVLSSTLTTIFGYYFGSSKSGLKKDEAMQGIAERVSQKP
jgi:predicted NBD/HSP70 family sugar kinase